jgi:hypothetical protein
MAVLLILCSYMLIKIYSAFDNVQNMALIAGIWVLLLSLIHVKRTDWKFLRINMNYHRLICSIEYIALSIPLIILSLLQKQWLPALSVLLLSFGTGFVDIHLRRQQKTPNTRLQQYIPSDMYEWKAGIRQYFFPVTGREYLSLFSSPAFDINQWNELFLLPLDQITDEYSAGMKKKLALLGVIMQNKPVILLDEPFNSLDLEMCRIIRSVLLKLKETGKTIIISSHIMETLTNLCNCIHYLEKGKIKYSIQQEDFAAFEKEIFAVIEKDNTKMIDELIIHSF